MKIKMIDAIQLYSVINVINVGSVESDDDKLKMIRLCVRLKKYAQQWDETVKVAKSMDPQAAQTLLDKESASEVEIDSDMLVSTDVAEKIAVSNSNKLNAGALGALLDYIVKD